MGLADFLARLSSFLQAPAAVDSRSAGLPTSSNGASSFHLRWKIETPPDDPFVELGATLQVVDPPVVDRLYFWALQASIADGRRVMGGAHLGIQHHPRYPGNRSANWGGYHGRDSGRSGELPGGELGAPSALGNPNTCNFAWRPNTAYRLRIERASQHWRGSITDLAAATLFVVRDLHCPGDRLINPIVWTEAFARCDDESTTVEWSDLHGVTVGGRTVPATAVSVNYQTVSDGGCSNTNSARTDNGFAQTTNVDRLTSQDSVLIAPRE